jgi:adenylyltransferase/sulfurtransferase
MNFERYRRQIILKEIGKQGQELLSNTKAVLIGGGGLGSHSADILVRMGIGSLRIIDDDIIQESNIHRTSLFSDQDIGKPKTQLLYQKLSQINSTIRIEAIQKKVTKTNISSLITDADIIIDGTDSLLVRLLINDASVKHQIPWVFSGISGTMGMVMAIRPPHTPCLRCICSSITDNDNPLPILGNAPPIIAGIQCTEILRTILDHPSSGLITYDIWNHHFHLVNIQKNPSCICCAEHIYTMLSTGDSS